MGSGGWVLSASLHHPKQVLARGPSVLLWGAVLDDVFDLRDFTGEKGEPDDDDDDVLRDLVNLQSAAKLPGEMRGDESEASDCEGQDAVQDEIRAIHRLEHEQAVAAAEFGELDDAGEIIAGDAGGAGSEGNAGGGGSEGDVGSDAAHIAFAACASRIAFAACSSEGDAEGAGNAGVAAFGPFAMPGSDSHPDAIYDEYMYDPEPSGRIDILNNDGRRIGQLQPLPCPVDEYRAAVRCKNDGHKNCSRQRGWTPRARMDLELPNHVDRVLVKWVLAGQGITEEAHQTMPRE